MKPLSLHSLLVFAPDLPAAREFYTEVLGCEVIEEKEASILLRGADFSLAVFKCESPTNPEGHSRRAGSTIAFAVRDLEAEADRLRALGVTVLHERPAVGQFGNYVAFVDPFGTVLEFVESLG
jgi:catechol 2,3-dioxygenase-like lactoylglutathione lyase family enzyme